MRVRARRLLVVMLLSSPALLGARHAVASDPPLTKAQLTCQSATAKGLGAYGVARARCIAKCQKKTPLGSDCSTPFAGKTLDCVSKADAKLAALLTKKCGSNPGSCPQCFEALDGTCSAFGTDLTAQVTAFVDSLAHQVFCDDSMSADGFTKAEKKCEVTVMVGLSGFVPKAIACVGACLKNAAKGKTTGSCNPAAFLGINGSVTADSKTLKCLEGSLLKGLAKVERPCSAPKGETPQCLSDASNLFTTIQDSLNSIGADVDVCPILCGDGFTQGHEQCDPGGPGGTPAPNDDACPGACRADCTCPSS